MKACRLHTTFAFGTGLLFSLLLASCNQPSNVERANFKDSNQLAQRRELSYEQRFAKLESVPPKNQSPGCNSLLGWLSQRADEHLPFLVAQLGNMEETSYFSGQFMWRRGDLAAAVLTTRYGFPSDYGLQRLSKARQEAFYSESTDSEAAVLDRGQAQWRELIATRELELRKIDCFE